MRFSSHCRGSTPACVFIENLLQRRGTLVDRFHRECLSDSASLSSFAVIKSSAKASGRSRREVSICYYVSFSCAFLVSATEYPLTHTHTLVATHLSLIGVRLDVLHSAPTEELLIESGLLVAQTGALRSVRRSWSVSAKGQLFRELACAVRSFPAIELSSKGCPIDRLHLSCVSLPQNSER